MKYSIIVLLTFLPVVLQAQEQEEVRPLISKDYLERVRDTTLKRQHGQRTPKNSIGSSLLRVQERVNPSVNIRRIRILDTSLYMQAIERTELLLGGSYTAVMAFKSPNRQPEVQSKYAQGRAVNGALVWRGPETNELFSYGPDIGSLNAPAFDNGILRTGNMFSQSFHVNGEYHRKGKMILGTDIKLGQANENTIIKQNENDSRNLSADLYANIRRFSIKGRYTYLEDRYSNSNRNGFLNRLYQYSLLTPATFDNSGGSSYSNAADNPYFLLDNNGNFFKRKQHNAGLTFSRSGQDFNFSLIQSLEKVDENSSEGYKPGTVSFPDGIAILRNKNDQAWVTHLNMKYKLWGETYWWKGFLSANYLFTDERSDISYAVTAAKYNYQRSSQELLLSHIVEHTYNSIYAQLEAGNRVYSSNTATGSKYFQPLLSGILTFNSVFYAGFIKLSGSYNQFSSELPVNRSLAHVNLLRYSTALASQFLPYPEVTGFDHLDLVRRREWTAGVTWNYKTATFTATTFLRQSRGDVFPVYNNGRLELQNIADHTNKGIELLLNLVNSYNYYRQVNWSTDLSFFAYRDQVTDVRERYNFLPLAGFSNVHKAIVKGASIGSIAGTSYLRDAAGNIVIGSDGFPMVNNEMKVIGDAIPDWVAKLSQRLIWKQFTLNIDLEWKKGGDIWNGTQATLDYYGRSQSSAALRDTKGYIFEGVLQDGHVNNIPVDFYNPSASFSQNRWLRYGESGVAEAYIQRADHLRINIIQLSHEWRFKGLIRKLIVSGNVNNLLLWTPYKGADPNQLLYDQANTTGLDFFNLPSAKTFGCNVSIQF